MTSQHNNLKADRSIQADWELTGGGGNNLGLMRCILAMMVAYSHCFPLTGQSAMNHWTLAHLDGGQITSGSLAVDLFFVLSGFLITRAYLNRKSLVDFLFKRGIRIYPAYFASWIVALCVVAPIAIGISACHYDLKTIFQNILKAVLLWQPGVEGIFPHNPVPGAINGSLWTLRYEFGFYALTILLGSLTLLKKRSIPLVLFVSAWAATILQHYNIIPSLSSNVVQYSYFVLDRPEAWLRLGMYFLSGMVFYLYRDRIPFDRHLAVIATCILIASLILPFHLFAVTAPGVAPYILFSILFSKWPKWKKNAQANQKEKMKRSFDLTNISYGIYLYAFPIQQLFVHFTHNTLHPYLLFFLAMPCAIVAAVLNWLLIDRPLAKRLHVIRSAGTFAVALDSRLQDDSGKKFTFSPGGEFPKTKKDAEPLPHYPQVAGSKQA